MLSATAPPFNPPATLAVMDPGATPANHPTIGSRRSPRLNPSSAAGTSTTALPAWVPANWTFTEYASTDFTANLGALAQWTAELMPPASAWHRPSLIKLAKKLMVNSATIHDLRKGTLTCQEYPAASGDEDARECARRSRLILHLETVVTMPVEIDILLRKITFGSMRIADMWAGTGSIKAVFAKHGLQVFSSDAHPAAPNLDMHGSALDIRTYAEMSTLMGGIDCVVSSPDFRFMDLALPMAVAAAKHAVFIHAPGEYVPNAPLARQGFINKWKAAGLWHEVMDLPKGPRGWGCYWIVIFKSLASAEAMLNGGRLHTRY
jgi:hypothetical protein